MTVLILSPHFDALLRVFGDFRQSVTVRKVSVATSGQVAGPSTLPT